MKPDLRHRRPEPLTAQVRRLQLKHGLSEPNARLVAALYFGERDCG